MRGYSIIFVCFFIIVATAFCEASEKDFSREDFSITAFSLRNPFDSPLPKLSKRKNPETSDRRKEEEDAYVSRPSVDEFLEDISRQLQRMNQDKKSSPDYAQEPRNPAAEIEMTGRVWNTDRPQVIMDGKVLDVGDVYQGMKILRVYKEGVDVSFQGRVFSIKDSPRR